MRDIIERALSRRPQSPAPGSLLERIAGLSHRPWQLDRGRAIQLGHLRGWGLEYGPLAEEITAQKDFAEAFELARSRGSLLTLHKLMNLYMLIVFGLPELEDGDIVEFGSYRGGSAIFMASLLRAHGVQARVFALDTYGGMPKTDAVRDLHHEGDFKDTSFDDFSAAIASAKLGDWLVPVKGVFDATFPAIAASGRRIAIAHVDCDIYEGVRYAVEASRPLMVRDGYFVFDDPLHGSCLGAMQAIEETLLHEDKLFAEQMYPHPVYRYPPLA
ncbi:TylF/MycF/NovP-related O-methyltransferase [Lysobacter sp. 2RAF19]